jgi:hypothetical protein
MNRVTKQHILPQKVMGNRSTPSTGVVVPEPRRGSRRRKWAYPAARSSPALHLPSTLVSLGNDIDNLEPETLELGEIEVHARTTGGKQRSEPTHHHIMREAETCSPAGLTRHHGLPRLDLWCSPSVLYHERSSTRSVNWGKWRKQRQPDRGKERTTQTDREEYKKRTTATHLRSDGRRKLTDE